MQDWKQHSSRRSPYRRQRSSSISVRKDRGSTFIQAKSSVLKDRPRRKLISFFRNPFKEHPEPELLRLKLRNGIRKVFGMLILSGMLWLSGGTAYLGWSYFQQPLRDVRISGNQLLEPAEVLKISGLQPGILLADLDPYLVASRIQSHPIVKKVDVRREFPGSLHLVLFEQDPFVLVEKSDPNQYLPDKYWLLNREKLVLKSIPAGVIATPEFRDFPRIKGLSDPGITSGVKWNSLALERGLQFLETVGTWAEKTQPASDGNLEDLPPLLPSLSSTKGLVLDLTDPLNLMMRWRFSAEESGKEVAQKDKSLKPLSSPVLVQLGRDQYAERLKRLEELLPGLIKEHPEIKSIDLRYPDRVTLVP